MHSCASVFTSLITVLSANPGPQKLLKRVHHSLAFTSFQGSITGDANLDEGLT
jgi:hypothetical protein